MSYSPSVTAYSSMGSSLHGLQVDLCIPVVLQGLHKCHHVLCHGLQENLRPSTRSISCSPSVLTLVSAEFPSHLLTSLFSGCNYDCTITLSFFLLKSLITEAGVAVISIWPSLDQWHVCLWHCRHWLCQTWGKFLMATHRCHPFSPLATKVWPCKPNTWHGFVWVLWLLCFLFLKKIS